MKLLRGRREDRTASSSPAYPDPQQSRGKEHFVTEHRVARTRRPKQETLKKKKGVRFSSTRVKRPWFWLRARVHIWIEGTQTPRCIVNRLQQCISRSEQVGNSLQKRSRERKTGRGAGGVAVCRHDYLSSFFFASGLRLLLPFLSHEEKKG